MIENKLGIVDSVELARQEEKLSKQKAIEMFETGFLEQLEPGTFQSLQMIHKCLFGQIYDFAGKIRDVNLAKGNFRFAPVMYLEDALKNIEKCLKVISMKNGRVFFYQRMYGYKSGYSVF